MVHEAIVGAPTKAPPNGKLVIAGASLGTLFEWYDFQLYGTLAPYIGKHFFAGVNETSAFAFALIAFAAGFIARPFGALVFGRIGDLVGRKNTFLMTLTVMGLSTLLVGLLPGFATLGLAAPILLLALRVLQGLAIGGEYGGAAIYVAEHAPPEKRALHTSWINAMGTTGLVTSLLVTVAFRLGQGAEAFSDWGWRGPFVVSAGLLAVSLWIRLKLGESPVFQKMKADGATSKAPYAEAFGRWSNLRRVLVALFGWTCGGTTAWYTAHLYALFFLQQQLKVDNLQAYALICLALGLAAPSYLLFGWVSDRLGRKPLILASCALLAATAFPLFHLLTWGANPALAEAQRRAPVTLYAAPGTCSVQFDPVGSKRFDEHGCDIAKAFLSKAGISYRNIATRAGAAAELRIGARVVRAPELGAAGGTLRKAQIDAFKRDAAAALAEAGYPMGADPARVNAPLVVGIVALLATLAAMAYAPQAAFLVELFPARIRYTSLSLPYHVGTGWVGGLLPASAFAIVAATGDRYAGLWYPVAFCVLTTIVGLLFIPETRGRPID